MFCEKSLLLRKTGYRVRRRFLRLDEQSDTSRRLRFIEPHKRSSWIYVARKMRYAQMRSRRETSAGCICSPLVACGPEAGWLTKQFVRRAVDTPHGFTCGCGERGNSPTSQNQNCQNWSACRGAERGNNQKRSVESRPEKTIPHRLNLVETSEIVRVLTPDQQKEAQKRIADRQASEQQEQYQSKPTASPATASPTPAAP